MDSMMCHKHFRGASESWHSLPRPLSLIRKTIKVNGVKAWWVLEGRKPRYPPYPPASQQVLGLHQGFLRDASVNLFLKSDLALLQKLLV